MEISNGFVSEIEVLSNSKNIPYLDAILIWSEKNGYDIESVALLIKKEPVLRQKIKIEAESVNLLKSKRGNILPL